MPDEKYLEALKNYYELKKVYEKQYYQKKLNIIKQTNLSTKEKKQKFQEMKKLCINCKKEGGTIFTNKNNTLKALCGNESNPCKLNIELQKGIYKSNNYYSKLFKPILQTT